MSIVGSVSVAPAAEIDQKRTMPSSPPATSVVPSGENSTVSAVAASASRPRARPDRAPPDYCLQTTTQPQSYSPAAMSFAADESVTDTMS